MHDLSYFMKPRMLMNVPLVSEARKSKFMSKENIFPKKPPSEKRTTLHEARTHALSTKILPVELLLYSLHYKKLKSQLLTNGGILKNLYWKLSSHLFYFLIIVMFMCKQKQENDLEICCSKIQGQL